VEAVRHMRAIRDAIAELSVVPPEELVARARDIGAPLELVKDVAKNKRLPVVLFCAGGVSTPADAALMMQLGAEGLFVGSGIFKAAAVLENGVAQYDENGFPKIDPALALRYARAIVEATLHYDDPKAVVAAHLSLAGAKAMAGIDLRSLPEAQMLSIRGN
jgi:pyridoxal 5'-phosphate synthase pdxS subunit